MSPRFHDAEGVQDWRVVFEGACAHFRTGSFAAGVALVNAIGELADAVDLDLRPDGVTVRLRSGERDSTVARQISSAARELGIPADPSLVQTIQVAIDARSA